MVIRKDKLKNKAKVVKEIIKEPFDTQRDTAKKAWVSLGTANKILQELEQSWTKGMESQILDDILDNDDKIIALSNWVTYDTIKKNILDWDVSLTDTRIISELANNSTKRKAIFWKKEDNPDKWPIIITM